jgi:serine/threonine protein kinase
VIGKGKRFELGERVGLGAAAEVRRALDTERGVPVAIKRLHEHLSADPISRDQFERETRLSARIDSEHVVRYMAHGLDEDDRPYLVLEWLEGEDLARRMRSGPLLPEESIEIVRQAALGLQALHDAGIVHRDIKPGNLFLVPGAGGRTLVKLIDLGVAHEGVMRKNEAIALGTPFYMSPEQARGDASISPRSDLFSLGVLLFELLTGKKPFTGEGAFGVLAKIALQTTPRLRGAWEGAPPALEALVRRAMARDPAGRFASAREMAEAIAASDSMAPGPASSEDGAPSPSHAVCVLFGRLPLSNDVSRSRAVFHRLATEYGGKAYSLLGRSVVVVFEGNEAEMAMRAATAGLVMVRQIPGVRLSIAMGVGLAPGEGLAQELIERGTRTLDRPRTDPGEPPVRVDERTARVLETQFAIEGAPGSLSLRGTRSGPPSDRP